MSSSTINPSDVAGSTSKITNKVGNKKKIIIAVVIIIIVFIIYAYFSATKTENKAKKMLQEDILEANNPRVIPDCEVNKPLNGIDFSCCFWIYLDKFYDNHLSWRHIFHKGTPLDSYEKVIDYGYWEVLIADYPEQCPGLWLDPNLNTIRFSFTTEITKDYKDTKHPHASTTFPSLKFLEKNALIRSVEYCDLPNVPVEEMVHLAFIINNDIIDIYMNGKQIKTCNFKGIPKFNKEAFYFNFQKTYNGFIKDFKYYPDRIKPDLIYNLSQKQPASK